MAKSASALRLASERLIKVQFTELAPFEDEGLVTSHWDVGEGGPARRLYSLSDEGEEMLHAWAVHIRQQRKRMDAFLERYQSIFGKQN